MQKKFPILFLSVTLPLVTIGCDKEESSAPSAAERPAQAPAPAKAPTKTAAAIDAASAFPAELGGYKRKGVKTKAKDWGQAYSATYQKSGDELKVVINDAPPNGREAWAVFFKDGKKFKGKPVAMDPKPGKLTMMVRVGKRFRVDFKTRTMTEEVLRKAANDFDFAAVRKLAR